jgi:hypothetical protein
MGQIQINNRPINDYWPIDQATARSKLPLTTNGNRFVAYRKPGTSTTSQIFLLTGQYTNLHRTVNSF